MDKNKTNSGCGATSGCLEHITCEVGTCAYNSGKMHCTAKQIKVGPGFASTTAETNCSTFKAK